MSIVLNPGSVCLNTLEQLWRTPSSVTLADSARELVERSANIIKDAVVAAKPVYGVNTGFGKLASVQISPQDTTTLQRNLILSHCCGVGEPLDSNTTRLMMALKLISLGRGASGVRWETCTLIEKMISHNIIPIIPSKGSVGASGDLAPLAHMAAVMIGEGEAIINGERLNGREALERCGLRPITLGPKEGLALINGTQFSTAACLAALFDAFRLLRSSVVTSCLSTDAIMGSTQPLHQLIHTLRGHQGQIDIAAEMRRLLHGSLIRESHVDNDNRVQDPYCIRCQPQVTGAALDLLRQVATTLETEANAVTDNPLVTEDGIFSGGNFHAEPVAFAADLIALALAEIGAISQRRVALMVDPTLSCDLPPFLTPAPGLNSGFMIAEVTSAALMSENKHLANPCSTDSTPTSANQEDHVSMAAHGAIRLRRMLENLSFIVGIEALCATQGIETRAPLKTSAPLQAAMQKIRDTIKPLERDRYMANDLNAASTMMLSDELAKTTELNITP